MSTYNQSASLREGLAEYLRRYNLGDGGYNDRWFKIKFFWKFVITLPNIDNRVRAVKFHDLHHVLTDYPTGLRGEAEIGAWEIASGCGKYYAAWILNAGSLFYGMFLYPRTTFRAFVRGRRSKNLYKNVEYDAALLAKSVGSTSHELHIPEARIKARFSDGLLYAACAAVLLALYIGIPIAVIALIV